VRITRFLFPAVALALASVPRTSGQPLRSGADSTFWPLSVQELQDYKKYYSRELDGLQAEKRALIRRGIETGERLLAEKSRSAYEDDILVRLGHLYAMQEKEDFFDSLKARDERTPAPSGAEPAPSYPRALAVFQRILDGFPKSEFVDDALYNQAFLEEETGRHDSANVRYRRLLSDYPQSQFAVEAAMRLGEYAFNPPVNDLENAVYYYKKVIEHTLSPRFPEALYKLGWSYYRLEQYPSAISYFTTLIETLGGEHPEGQPVSAVDLTREAVDYIAIAFTDYGGPAKAAEYLKKLGNPAWGKDVLEKLGLIYMEDKEDYPSAVEAYEGLIRMAPFNADAPLIRQRIAECRLRMKDEAGAFETRQALFLSCRSGGAWWNAVLDGKARLQAYRLSEQALRDNFNWLLHRAEASQPRDSSLYRRAVDLGRTYLEAFPEDMNALSVRWNLAILLDTQLRDYKEALQEYLTISMLYAGEAYVETARAGGLPSTRDAAENAVVMADTLVRRERRHEAPAVSARADTSGPVPLTDAEKWMVMATDNYIRLFPREPNTPVLLANTGALQFTHRNYDEALKYFKTLIRQFPDNPNREQVHFSILDSYMAGRDYSSAEIYGKKLAQEPEARPYLDRVRHRLAEAVFMNAQNLAGEGRSREAGAEFMRMALESPQADFADRALFNAGRSFDAVRDYDSAIQAYENLRASYPGSPRIADALQNVAVDLAEKGEFLKSAARYEELYWVRRPDSTARDALFNARLFYAKAEDWIKATEIGERYAVQYPGAPDAAAVFYQTAETALRTPNPGKALDIYARFGTLFPASPAGVELWVRLGRHFEEADSPDQAESWYRRAVSKNDSLRAAGGSGNPPFAADALFRICRIRDREYGRIVFRLPESDMKARMDRMQALMERQATDYARVASYRTDRMPESLYRIGETYERFARTWSEQEIPPMEPIARAVKEKTVRDRTVRVYGQGLEAYRAGLSVLSRLNAEPAADGPSDSLRSAAVQWAERIRPKISETLYRIAGIHTATLSGLLGAPVPSNLSGLASLEYRSQVLVKVIRPIVEAAAQAHLRNLSVSDSLSLRNAWVDSSRSRIRETLGLIGRRYESLTWEALRQYRSELNRYAGNPADPAALPEEWIDTVVNALELSQSYAKAALIFGKDGLERSAKIGTDPVPDSEARDRLMRFALRLSDTVRVMAAENASLADRTGKWAAASRLPEYEGVSAMLDDDRAYFSEYDKVLLEEAAETDRAFQPASPAGVRVRVRLIRTDPGAYLKKWNLSLLTLWVPSDSTWEAGRIEAVAAAGSGSVPEPVVGWAQAGVFPSTGKSDPGNAAAVRIGAARGDTLNARRALRKTWEVNGWPVFSGARFATGSPARIRINGFEWKPATGEAETDVSEWIIPGRNRIDVSADAPGAFWLEGSLRIQYVPEPAKGVGGGP
jgi:cellulose synthase operon protein C